MIVSPPIITTQPQAQTLLEGSTATLSVQAIGDSPLTYQWRRDGANLADGGNLSGSATANLTLTNLAPADGGLYSVVVSNDLGAVPSANAQITVIPILAAGSALDTLYEFSTNYGFNPSGGLLQANDGWLYGTTQDGGPSGDGAIFRLPTNGAVSFLAALADTNGYWPFGELVPGRDGGFYGTGLRGGVFGYGTVFKLATNGAIETPLSFDQTNGSYPYTGLAQGMDGSFYGVCSEGGSYGYGTIFRMTPAGQVTTLVAFDSNNGAYPYARLLTNGDGSFYGAVSEGGAYGYGAIFRVTTNGGFSTLYSFTGSADGREPWGGLIQGKDGALYGTTVYGGSGGRGTVFRLAATGALTTLAYFNTTNGAYPEAGLVQGTDGYLYGTTAYAGWGGQGTVFRLSTNGSLTTLVWFTGANGANPVSPLIQASDGSFYGTALCGGNDFTGSAFTGDGTVFRLTVPTFIRDPILKSPAMVGYAYNGTVAGDAVSPPQDPLLFSKVSGPAWLQIGSAGALGGTPAAGDLGTNSFAVAFQDANGLSGSATLLIPVLSPPAFHNVTRTGAGITLSWDTWPGLRYQPQYRTNLVDGGWLNLGDAFTATNASATLIDPVPADPQRFYRILLTP